MDDDLAVFDAAAYAASAFEGLAEGVEVFIGADEFLHEGDGLATAAAAFHLDVQFLLCGRQGLYEVVFAFVVVLVVGVGGIDDADFVLVFRHGLVKGFEVDEVLKFRGFINLINFINLFLFGCFGVKLVVGHLDLVADDFDVVGGLLGDERALHVAFHDFEALLVVDEVELVADVLAFAVDVDPFVDVARHPYLVGFEHLDVLGELEVVGIDEGTGDGDMLDGDLIDDADVDEAVVEFGLWGDGGVVAELVGVGEGGEPGFALDFFAVEDEGVVLGFVGGVLAEDEVEVGGEAAELGGLHEAGDEGVEAYAGDAGDVELIVEGDGVDGAGVVLVEDADGEGGGEGYLHAASKAVAAAAGDDAEGGVAAVHAGDDVVDAAVAANGGDDVEAFVGALAGDVGAVVDMFGIAYLVVVEVLVEVGVEEALNFLLTSNTRDGVDDY